MQDDKTQTALDRKLINTSDAYELRDWAHSLGVSEDRIREAVAAVGSSAAKVRAYLKAVSPAGGGTQRA